MGNVRCVAVDWSGDDKSKRQREKIWVGVAEGGQLLGLTNGFTRERVVAMLVGQVNRRRPVFIGLDFAFSFPQWYLAWRGLRSVRELWELAVCDGEIWLDGRTWPFYGRGCYPTRPAKLEGRELRNTDERQGGTAQPQSVFKLVGYGQVGPGTIRGLPALVRLQDAGASIWPFDGAKASGATVVEIFPRLFYGMGVVKNTRASRECYLRRQYDDLQPCWLETMIGSDDAFDAGVSALVMSTHVEELQRLQRAEQPPESWEGEIWRPA